MDINQKQKFVVEELCKILSKVSDDEFLIEVNYPFVQIYRNSKKYGRQMRLASAIRRLSELLKTLTNAD